MCGCRLFEPPGTALGLIDLYGSVADFETALAARQLEVAELSERTDLFKPATARNQAVQLPPADAALLRGWLTFDASYLWGDDFEWPAFSQGVRVTFYDAGKVVRMDLHLADGVAVVTNGDAVSIVKLAPIPVDIEQLLARVFS